MRKYLPLFVYPPTVVLLDLLSKWWIVRNIPLGQGIPILPNFFDLVHFRNPGVAFSLFADLGSGGKLGFFFLVTLAAMIALFVLYAKTQGTDRKMQIPLALILGGALGNMLDRLYRGEVVDFLYFHWYHRIADFELFGRHFRFVLAWPAFNIADSAITCGALYLALKVLFLDSDKPPHKPKPEAERSQA
jgi:signal peptidase II